MHHPDHASLKDPATWLSLSEPACEVAKTARYMQRLYEAHCRADSDTVEFAEVSGESNEGGARFLAGERLAETLAQSIDASRMRAVYARASSALGAQHQTLIASCLIDELWDLVPETDPDTAVNSTEIKSQLNWLLYSIIAVLEQASGVAREEIGAAYYMTREQDPHLAVRRAIEVAS